MEEQRTIDAYNTHAEYWRQNYSQPNYWDGVFETYQKLLPAGSVIEIGAGAGRDANDLIARGYEYYGTEPAERLVAVARRENPGATFEQKSVYDLKAGEFDGFWAAAVLLHIPRTRMCEALAKIRGAVRNGAIGFIAIKEGDGEYLEEMNGDVDSTRLFVLWRDADFRAELVRAGFEVIEYVCNVKSERTIWLQYIVRAI